MAPSVFAPATAAVALLLTTALAAGATSPVAVGVTPATGVSRRGYSTCPGTKSYELTLQIDLTLPGVPPSLRAVSPVTLVAHREEYVMFKTRGVASDAIVALAERNDPSVLEAELADAQANGLVRQVFTVQPVLKDGVGEIKLRFTVKPEESYMSLVGRLSSSDGWFFGLSSPIDLCDYSGLWHPNGDWLHGSSGRPGILTVSPADGVIRYLNEPAQLGPKIGTYDLSMVGDGA
eukprot:contig_19807_g4883